MNAVFPGEHENYKRCENGAAKGCKGNEVCQFRCNEHQRHGRKTGTGRYADNTGIGQGIAQNPLQDTAGQGKVRPRQGGTKNAGQTNVINNPIVFRRRQAAQHIGHFVQRNRHGAGCNAAEKCDGKQSDADQER